MTFGQICGWAFGVLHLSRKDFYEMSPAEYWAALDAHTCEVQAGRMHTGELARGLGIRIFNLLVGKEHRIHKVQEFWQMPWDDKSSSHEQAELERLNALKGDDLTKEIELFYKRTNGRK